MSQLATRPASGAEPLRAPDTSTDGPVIRAILILAPVAALVAGIGAAFADTTPSPGEMATTIVMPTIVGALVLIGRTRPGFLRAAAFGLNIEAILAGCFVSVGLAFAVVLPIVGVGLVQPQLRGRQMIGALVSAGLAAVAGVAAAVLVGPAHLLFIAMPAAMPILGFATIVVFGLALQWRANRQLFAALQRAEEEIAARDLAEAELDRASEILSAIVQSSPVATQAFDLDRNVTIWNPASERTFGWTAEEVVGAPMPMAMTPPEERMPSLGRIERTMAGTVTAGERVRRMTKDGQERWIDIYAAPLRDKRGRPIGVAGQLVDVTERVQLEAQLLQAQKLEAIGLLSSGLAHDFNNTLTIAGGFAALIRAETVDPQVRKDAAAIIEVVEKSRELTRRLLAVGRESDATVGPVDVCTVIVDLAPLLRQTIGSTIEVELDLPDRPMVARIDQGQLEQALLNLAVNARDAMPHGGQLTISAGASDTPCRGFAQSATTATRGQPVASPSWVEVVVRDTGSGIPAAIMDRIFEPFVTTKPAGKGSGLGLSMVSGFAARAGGEVTVQSEHGRGTAFVIRLPEVVDEPAEPKKTLSDEPRTIAPRSRPTRRVAAMRPAGAHFEAHAS
jgi:PAS domain S-box-containing protein